MAEESPKDSIDPMADVNPPSSGQLGNLSDIIIDRLRGDRGLREMGRDAQIVSRVNDIFEEKGPPSQP